MNPDDGAPCHRTKRLEITVFLQRNGSPSSKELMCGILGKVQLFEPGCSPGPFYDFNGSLMVLCRFQKKSGDRHPMASSCLTFLEWKLTGAKEDYSLALVGQLQRQVEQPRCLGWIFDLDQRPRMAEER